MSHALSDGPLAGLRVIDFTRVVAGPLTAQCLADLGADVIKVERPGSGDDTRQWPPYFKDADGEDVLGESVYIQVTNRNKRSITIDIRQPEGQALMKRLMSWADVFIENLKVGDLDRYGLSYDKVKDEYPHLIYCSVTGFGQTGPYAKRPGYDILAQGAAGLMSVTGEPDGMPMKVGVAVGDIQAGLHAAVAILAAVHARTATGKGQWIDVSLLDCQAWGMINFASNYLNAGQVATRNGTAHPSVVPYQVFESRDGHVILGVTTDYQFAKFCECAGTSGMGHRRALRDHPGASRKPCHPGAPGGRGDGHSRHRRLGRRPGGGRRVLRTGQPRRPSLPRPPFAGPRDDRRNGPWRRPRAPAGAFAGLSGEIIRNPG